MAKPTSGRLTLGTVGLVIVGIGVAGLPTEMGTHQLLQLLGWLAAAVLLHDGVLVPLTTAAGYGIGRLGRGWTAASRIIFRTALGIGVLLSLLVPLLLKARSLNSNPTLLTENFTLHLAVAWLLLISAAAAGIYVVERRRRLKTLP